MPWWIVVCAGLEDGLNPCVLMTTAVFLILNMWVRPSGYNGKRALIFFSGAYVLLNIVLNASFLSVFLWSGPVVKVLTMVNKVDAFLIGLAALVFFYQWVFLRIKKGNGKDISGYVPKVPNAFMVLSSMVLCAFAMSVLSTVWPSNYYVTVISNNMLLPGRLWSSLIVFVLYFVIQAWLLFVMWIVINKIRLPDALRMLIVSAFLFVASGMAFYLL